MPPSSMIDSEFDQRNENEDDATTALDPDEL